METGQKSVDDLAGSGAAEREFWVNPVNKETLTEALSVKNLVLKTPTEILRFKVKVFLGVFGLLACLYWLFFNGQKVADWYHLKHHARSVTGKITQLTVHSGKNKTYSMDWTYRLNEKTHEGSEKITSEMYRNNKIGSSVPLLIDKDRPSHSLLSNKSDVLSYVPNLMFNLLCLVFSSVFAFKVHEEHKKERQLKEQGSIVKGEVVSARTYDTKHEKGTSLYLRLNMKSYATEVKYDLKEVFPDHTSPGTKVQALYLSPKNFKLL